MIYVQNVDGLWYVFEGDENKNQVFSVGMDSKEAHQQGARRFFATWNDSGIKYVSHGVKTKRCAIARAKKESDEITIIE